MYMISREIILSDYMQTVFLSVISQLGVNRGEKHRKIHLVVGNPWKKKKQVVIKES